MADDREPLLEPNSNEQINYGARYDTDQTSKPKLTKHLVLAIASCTLGSSFQFGFNTGVVNSPEKVMKQFYNESYYRKEGKYMETSFLTLLWALTVAMYAVGGMLGGVSAGYWGNKFGRRGALLRNNIIAVVAAVLLGCSKLADSYEMLIVGRFVCGVNAGTERLQARLKPTAIPHIFPWQRSPSESDKGRRERCLRRKLDKEAESRILEFHIANDLNVIGEELINTLEGINTGLAPLYLSEIAPIHLRGFCGTFNQMSITFGVLISQILGLDYILGTKDLWPVLVALTIVPVFYQMCTLTFCCESPRYLMLNKQDGEETIEALVWLRSTTDVTNEIEEMKNEAEEQTHCKKFSVVDLISSPSLRTPLMISLVLHLSQQFSGINAVIYYSTDIFTSAGLSDSNSEYATVGVSMVNVLMTFVSAFLMDRLGRRTLHLTGLGGMFVFTAVLTVSRIFQPSHHWLSLVCIPAVVFYIVFFAIGPGSIPWFIVAELFTQGPRTAAMSVAVLVNWLANCLVGFIFPVLQSAVDAYSFVPFVVFLGSFWLFTYLMLPETKGKPVEEIAQLFIPKNSTY